MKTRIGEPPHQQLLPEARVAIAAETETARQQGGSPELLVSAIACWEVAMLVSRGRLALSVDVERWLSLLASHPAVRLLPLDPADRTYDHVRSLWPRGRHPEFAPL